MIIKSLFKVHFFYYVTAFICMITGNIRGFLLFNVIILVHELGHVSLALFFGWNIRRVVLLPFGALTQFEEKINRPLFEEFIILLAGPFFQIVFTFVFCLFCYDDEFVCYSMMILIFNLLPIYPFDGSRILNVILNKVISFKRSHLVTLGVSLGAFFCVLIFFKVSFIVFLALLFAVMKVFEEFRNHRSLFNKFLLERRIYRFDFKKEKVVDDVKRMKRDFRHVFFVNGRYFTEKELLYKMFDFSKKMW